MKVFKWAISFSIALCSFAAVLIAGLYYGIDVKTLLLRSFLALIVGLLLGFLVFSELGIFIIVGGKKEIKDGSEGNESKIQ